MKITGEAAHRSLTAGLLALLLSVGGCDDENPDLTGPGTPGDGSRFSEDITLDQFEERIGAGPMRVEIKLLPGSPLTAREVEIEEPEEIADREEIESRVLDLTVSGDQGTLDLAIDGLVVRFDASTRFRDDDRDLTLSEFVSRVESALAAGARPSIEAKRNPPAEPQAPDDANFLATRLELDDEFDESEIEINVDGDNFEPNPDAGPGEADAWLLVLGLRIELRVGEGVTELESDLPEAAGAIDFEGIVEAVELDDDGETGSVTLASGTTIRVIPGTEIEQNSGSDDDHLRSLAEVKAAVESGLRVEADGEGVVESTSPRIMVAIEIEFEIEDDADDDDVDDDDVTDVVEFEDAVSSVDVAAGTVTLMNGTIVRVSDDRIDPDGDLLTLQAVADAVTAGRPVRAEGDATVEDAGPPPVLVALDVKFEVDD